MAVQRTEQNCEGSRIRVGVGSNCNYLNELEGYKDVNHIKVIDAEKTTREDNSINSYIVAPTEN